MYKSYRKEVDQAMDRAILKTLTAIGIFLIGRAKLLVPVDTGRLKNSLQYDAEGKELYYGSGDVEGQPVNYATFVEKKKPFIKPSVFDNKEKIERLANRIFRKELS